MAQRAKRAGGEAGSFGNGHGNAKSGVTFLSFHLYFVVVQQIRCLICLAKQRHKQTTVKGKLFHLSLTLLLAFFFSRLGINFRLFLQKKLYASILTQLFTFHTHIFPISRGDNNNGECNDDGDNDGNFDLNDLRGSKCKA